jgi:hypothetical protein
MSTDTHRAGMSAEELAAEDALSSALNARESAYPVLKEQFDMLFHDIENGTLDTTGEFYTAIKAVKDAYPKP